MQNNKGKPMSIEHAKEEFELVLKDLEFNKSYDIQRLHRLIQALDILTTPQPSSNEVKDALTRMRAAGLLLDDDIQSIFYYDLNIIIKNGQDIHFMLECFYRQIIGDKKGNEHGF